MEKEILLKVLVGSQAHGLANEKSDWDYRGVFIEPTSRILSLGYKYKANDWFEGKEDQTLYEIGHFLHLATKCNASILEVFKGPCVNVAEPPPYDTWLIGKELQDLFPYVWNPKDAFSAFVGYSNNQRKKLLDNKDNRDPKFACAYLRTLYNLEQLLIRGDFTLDVTHNPILFKRLKEIRAGEFTIGDIINEAELRIKRCATLRDKCTHKPDLEKSMLFS
jgi:predicted nucleotidyltransferase